MVARLGVCAAVMDGDAGLAFRLVLELMGQGVPFETVLLEVLAPIQADLGRRWQSGDYRIAEEHAATSAIETVVALLAGSFDRPAEGGHVVVACAEGDSHSLPARMVSTLLAGRGWRVTFLGGTLPADDLGEFLADVRPDALVLSCAIVAWLGGARACVRAAHRAGVPVLVGGRGFGPDGRRAAAIGADGWAPGLGAVDDVLRTWEPDPDGAEAAAVAADERAKHLERVVTPLVAEAWGLMEPALGGERPTGAPHPRDELTLMLMALYAALLVDDPTLVEEFATWEARTYAAYPPLAGIEATLLEGLHRVVATRVPEAERYLPAPAAGRSGVALDRPGTDS